MSMADWVGLAINVFGLAIQAYEVFQQAIEFPESYSAVVLKLDVELTRLQLWGKHSGVSQGSLAPDLLPFESLIDRILRKLTNLLQDSARLKERYGLKPVEEVASNPGSHSKPLIQLRSVLRSIAGRHKVNAPTTQTGTLERVRWAISSQEQFKELVEEIRSYTNSLNELLLASQRATLQHDWERAGIRIVGAVDDPSGLSLVRQMARENSNCQNLSTMASRKAIVENYANQIGTVAGRSPNQLLLRQDFELPSNYLSLSRCIALYSPKSPSPVPSTKTYVLVEKKPFDSHIRSEDKIALLSRLHRLMTLLNTTSDNEQGMLTPSLGYWSEDDCWCLVYRCPFVPSSTIPPQVVGSLTSAQPLSLLHLLQSSSFRPALEQRLALANNLAAVLSRLYGGQWFHKGVRSDNIVFPQSPSPAFDISRPVIVGFEYSRQYTEPASIDFVAQDFCQAVYRHPDYQGEAANRTGYRLSYDIYSFGLLLAEIAWWVPLEKVYQDVMRKKPGGGNLSEYRTPQAKSFMEEISRKVGKEMAFRVGTVYQKVIDWCLKQGMTFADDKDLAVDFYSNVVVPLETISK
ncbi:hypothetical protein PQX77_005308 [Marasmius sp. AFHP31]|nr:hypothetical protein PQX77_005308 [Marasmius sp. AFHP31]